MDFSELSHEFFGHDPRALLWVCLASRFQRQQRPIRRTFRSSLAAGCWLVPQVGRSDSRWLTVHLSVREQALVFSTQVAWLNSPGHRNVDVRTPVLSSHKWTSMHCINGLVWVAQMD